MISSVSLSILRGFFVIVCAFVHMPLVALLHSSAIAVLYLHLCVLFDQCLLLHFESHVYVLMRTWVGSTRIFPDCTEIHS